jgi:uncharacterized YigZ family protein
MSRAFRTLRGPGDAALEIKRSRFLGHAEHAGDETAVQGVLARVRAAHPDAGHHCFAYRLGQEGTLARFSDDGEPGGTAGRPMMEVLLREEIVDAVVIVTRYFGGILLGAGGLARAYSQAAAEAIRAAGFARMLPHSVMRITVDYAHFGAIEQALQRSGYPPSDIGYTDRVTVTVPIPTGEEQAVARLVADLTAGQGRVAEEAQIYLPEQPPKHRSP